MLEEESPQRGPLDRLDRLRHELRSPLTTIRGRAYLLGRVVRRASSLSERERDQMLAGVAAIEEAVTTMATVIDGLDGDRLSGPGEEERPT